MLPEPPAWRPKFYYYFGKNIFDFPKKVILFWGNSRSSAQFWHFNPEPNFPKNLPLFWDFHPESNFLKNLPQFWDFLRIQILGLFILRFRYFEFTAYDCRSLEFTIGPTNILSLLVVDTNVFLVPLFLHWKKAADIGSPRWRNEVTQPNQSHIFIWLHNHVNPVAVPSV